MRYELYQKFLEDNSSYPYLYVTSSDYWGIILNYLEDFPVCKYSKYVIIDNETPNPVNYFQLGLESLPSTEEHYNIIHECKIAKEYYNHIKFDENNEIVFNKGDFKSISEAIFKSAKYQTELYFKAYNAKAKRQ